MPIQPDRFDRQRPAGSRKIPAGQESHEAPPPQETRLPPDKADQQDQPQQKRLKLTTPPADHRYMRGRY